MHAFIYGFSFFFLVSSTVGLFILLMLSTYSWLYWVMIFHMSRCVRVCDLNARGLEFENKSFWYLPVRVHVCISMWYAVMCACVMCMHVGCLCAADETTGENKFPFDKIYHRIICSKTIYSLFSLLTHFIFLTISKTRQRKNRKELEYSQENVVKWAGEYVCLLSRGSRFCEWMDKLDAFNDETVICGST